MRILVVCVWVAWALLPRTALASDRPTNGRVGTQLLAELLDRVATRIPPSDGVGIALRNTAEGSTAAPIDDAVAGYFFDRGYEVWVAQGEDDQPQEGDVVLEYALDAARFSYPRVRTSFLGLGTERVARVAEVSMTLALLEPESGHLVWRGEPRARYEDWVARKEQGYWAADGPTWANQDPLPQGAGASPWRERAAVLGLLAGVIVLYFSGAN